MYRRFLSVRYLRTRFVNFLSVAGVMTGVAVLIVVTSVMDGFQVKVREVLRGTLSHVILVPQDDDPPPYAQLDALLREDPRIVATAPHLSTYVGYPYPVRPAKVEPYTDANGSGWYEEGEAYEDWNQNGRHDYQPPRSSFHFMEAIGIDWAREAKVSRMAEYLQPGAQDPANPFRHEKAEFRNRGTVLVSRKFVETYLGTSVEEAIGDDLPLLVPREVDDPQAEVPWKADTYRPVISGVFDAEDQISDVGRIYLDIETLRKMAKLKPEYMEVRIALADYEQAAAVVKDLPERLRHLGMPFGVQTWEQVRAEYLRAVNTEKVMLLVVLSFIVLLAGFTILATLTLTVVEKTKDIGVVKALGGTTGGILSIFLRSGLLIGLVGGALGVVLGLFVTAHANTINRTLESMGIPIFPPNIYLFREIPTHVDPASVAGIAVGSAVIAFLAGLLPALRAARMDPVNALRYE